MIRALRNSCALAAALVFLVPGASADLKIKTRTTVMGHSTESTVYIRGARERREMSFGGRMAAVTITQCDQKRMVTMYGDNCTATQTGGQAACPAMPSFGAMMKGALSGEPSAPPRKGGTLTVTSNSTDTKERQEMFGYKARHIKTTMSMESSPDACNQSHMKIERDGWYADLSATFSCSDESARALACGGGGSKPNCQDRVVMKGGGGGALGFPLKETTTITSEQGTFTTTAEVIELSTVTLEPSLFEMPPNCRVMEATGEAAAPSAPPPPAAPPAASAAPPAASATPPAAKAAGVVRIGVVKLKDVSGEDLPTDNLRLNLMGEIISRHMDAVALSTESPLAQVVSEAQAKQCDYILFTTLKQMKEPGSGGLAAAALPKGLKLDATRFQALTEMTLYKVGKPAPEIKDLGLAADAARFGVDAVTATFEKEGDKVSQQVQEDAHPKSAPKAPARKPRSRSQPN